MSRQRQSAVQLTLFDTAAKQPARPQHDLAEITWSFSRRSLLEQCPRRYYYEYFGAAKRTAQEEPWKDQLRLLKDVQNRYERAGTILHRVIATFFRKAQEGKVWDVDRLVGWGRKLFRADREYSAAHAVGGACVTAGPYPPVLLHEYLYGLESADVLCDAVEEQLVLALQTFATDGVFASFRESGNHADALIEKHFRLPDLPCQVEGVIDLAYRDATDITIVDWKLGAGAGKGDDSLQMAVYALWAVDHFACRATDLHLYKAHLASGEIADFAVNEHLLATARARIVQDAERLAAVQSYGEAATVDAFTPCLQPAICALCPFARICLDGKQCGRA